MAENYFGITHTGKIRDNNEDTFIAEKVLHDRFIAGCVIDGVGGYEGGEVAATIARQSILEYFSIPSGDVTTMMREAFVLANDRINKEKENNSEKTLKHPNTDWRLVIHANGPDAPIKPMRNHYGVRVTNNAEVDRATEYLERKKEEFGIKIIKPRGNHNAYSVHFYEPGGNYWEIESYEHAVETGMGKTTTPHWNHPLPTEKFSGKGYVPQALTHGTLENEDLEAFRPRYAYRLPGRQAPGGPAALSNPIGGCKV